MGGTLSILFILLAGSRSYRDKFKLKADVAGKKLNRKYPARARRQKLCCREPSRILQKVLVCLERAEN